jgi:hypothetical protein
MNNGYQNGNGNKDPRTQFDYGKPPSSPNNVPNIIDRTIKNHVKTNSKE